MQKLVFYCITNACVGFCHRFVSILSTTRQSHSPTATGSLIYELLSAFYLVTDRLLS